MTAKQIHIILKKARVSGFVLLLLTLFALHGISQNTYRFSQYMFNELSVNPAYAGTKNAIVGNLIYRNQWMGIEGQPTTQILSLQSPVRSKKIGLGALLYKDNIGIQNDVGMYLSYAYHIRFDQSYLSFGLQAGMINKKINWNEIETASQRLNGEPDPVFPLVAQEFWMPNFGFGAYYYSEQYYIGMSMPRILANELPVDNQFADLFTLSTVQIHLFITAGYVFYLKNGIAFKPSLLFKRVKNTPSQLDLNMNIFLANGLNFGLGIHFKDSYVFMLGYSLSENLRLSYSFDLTVSNLAYNNPVTNEIVLSYMIHSKNDRIISPRYF